MMTVVEKRIPPAAADDTHLEIWKGMWSIEARLAALTAEVRIGLALMTLVSGVIIGRVSDII